MDYLNKKKYIFRGYIFFIGLCLLVIFLLLNACFSESEAEDKLTNQNNETSQSKTIDEETLEKEADSAEKEIFSKPDEEFEDYSFSEEESVEETEQQKLDQDQKYDQNDIISQIRVALDQGNYPKALRLSKKDNSQESIFYRGITYYSMMLETKIYTEEERKNFRNQAINYLSQTAFEAKTTSLKARGLLWYAVALHVSYTDLTNKKKAIDALFQFQQNRALRNTKYYNDALYYSGLIYLQIGWYGVTRNYFNKVALADRIDSIVYDYTENEYYSIQEASKKRLNELNRLIKAGKLESTK